MTPVAQEPRVPEEESTTEVVDGAPPLSVSPGRGGDVLVTSTPTPRLSARVRRLGTHALVFGGLGAGGALTGYLAARDTRGAIIGATVHMGIFGVGAGIFGKDRLTPLERIIYIGIGLVSGGIAGYASWTRR